MSLVQRVKDLFASSPYRVNWNLFAVEWAAAVLIVFAIAVCVTGFTGVWTSMLNYGLPTLTVGVLYSWRLRRALAERNVAQHQLKVVVAAQVKIAERQGRVDEAIAAHASSDAMQDRANEILIGARHPAEPGAPHVDMMCLGERGEIVYMHFGGENPTQEQWEKLAAAGLPVMAWEDAKSRWAAIDRTWKIKDAVEAALDFAETEGERLTTFEIAEMVSDELGDDVKAATENEVEEHLIRLSKSGLAACEDGEWFVPEEDA